MDAKRLARRLAAGLGTVALVWALVVVVSDAAQATPIRPDVRELVKQPASEPPDYLPARAGWKGPETSPAALAAAEARAARVRAVRQALAFVVTPDPRVLAALLAAILILRKLRERREARALADLQPEPAWQMPRAA